MLMLPPYMLVEDLRVKVVLGVFFAFLALLAGKHLRWWYYLILVVSVTFFHLLSPIGKVLLVIGPLTVSSGALENGLIRGVSLTGMIFLSLAAVRPELKFPGGFGGLLSRMFFYFDSILEGKKHLSRKNFLTGLDELLMDRFNPDREYFGGTDPGKTGIPEENSSCRGWLPAAAAALLPWILWFRTLFFGAVNL
jgi:heptaprenyl diphosphate synthase